MANESAKDGSMPALTSEWGALNRNLIAIFFPVLKRYGQNGGETTWVRDTSQPEVHAPITDASISAQLNWQSQFENMGPDSNLSTASALMQSGGFASFMEMFKSQMGGAASDWAAQQAQSLEGRSNLTKLNSTQVFTGMGPLNIPMTLHFRAWKDAATEVQQPMNKIMEWAVPQEIAKDGLLTAAMGGNAQLFPSRVPQIIGMKFAGMLLAPLVIENPVYPLDGPRDSQGNLTRAALTLQLSSLTAIDKPDWNNAFDPSYKKQFSY